MEEIEKVELCTTHAVIAGAPKWKEKVQSANTEELAKMPWIYPGPLSIYHKLIRHLFADNLDQLNWVTTSATEDSTSALLRAGVGLAFTRDDKADAMLKKEEIVVWPVEAFSLPLRLGYLKSRKDDPVVMALRDNITRVFQENCDRLPKALSHRVCTCID